MKPEDQLKVLAKIWGRERDGYVYLPWIDREHASGDKAERRKGWHESPAFKWPRDREKIAAHLNDHKGDDLFFTPHRFAKRKRVTENVADEVILFADLDDFPGRDDITTPDDIPADIKPSICWQTSTGSYQGVWLFGQNSRWNVYDTGRENQALTYHLGADPGGWHGSKVLRVPGSFNNKPDKQERGKLLWWRGDDAKIYSWEDIDDAVPKLQRNVIEDSLVTQQMIDAISPREVMSRLRFKMDKRTLKLLRQRHDPDKGERSEVQFSIAQELSDAGANLLEIVAVIQHSVWNKHRDEPSEIVRLVTLAQKVMVETKRRVDAGELTTVEVEAAPLDDGTLTPIGTVMGSRIKRPQWLVDGLWTTNACGWVAGAPKSYKSWLTMHLAACVAAGVPFMDRKVKQRKTLVIQMEDDEATVVDRMGRVLDGSLPETHPHGQLTIERGEVQWDGPSRELPLYYKIQIPFVSSDDSWQDWLDDLVEQNGIGLVMIDTMFASMGTIDISESQAVQSLILNPLKQMAKERNCAVMIVHHSTKSGDGSRAAQLLGSQALRGWADAGIYFGERDDDFHTVPVSIENKFGGSTSYGIDVSSLDADRVEPEELAEGYFEPFRSVWQPFERSLPGKDDAAQEDMRSTRLKRGDGEKQGPGGKSIAKILANVGINAEHRALDMNDLEDKINELTGKKRSEIKRQLENAIYNGYLVDDGNGAFYAGAHTRE